MKAARHLTLLLQASKHSIGIGLFTEVCPLGCRLRKPSERNVASSGGAYTKTPNFRFIMSNITPSAARQALRICSRRYPSNNFSHFSPRPATAFGHNGRRSYVSETKPINATVSVETAIKADQKAFLQKTGKRPQDEIMPTTGLSADTMNPSAGRFIIVANLWVDYELTITRTVKTGNYNGRRHASYLPRYASDNTHGSTSP
jgi:hypothetical protein